METMQDVEEVVVKIDGMEFYENDFEIAIGEACRKVRVDDLLKEGQARWKAVMHYVGKRVFPDNDILRDKNIIYVQGNKIPTNNNRYDYNILLALCDYYINLSRQYNKLISAVAFSEFINIPVNTIDKWQYEEPSTPTFQIWKKLQDNRQDSLKDKAVDNGNVMGVFQVGRLEYHWDMPGVRQDSGKDRALGLEEIKSQLQQIGTTQEKKEIEDVKSP